MSARGGLATSRWIVSFADLCLLLLGFFVLLQAHHVDRQGLAAGLRSALAGRPVASAATREAAAPLFDPGEAVLHAGARARFVALGEQAAAAHGRVRVESVGMDRASHRFEGWELSAARVASVARAIADGGLDERAIDVAIPSTADARPVATQTISVEIVAAS